MPISVLSDDARTGEVIEANGLSQENEHETSVFRVFCISSVVMLVMAWMVPSDLTGIIAICYAPAVLAVALRRCLRLNTPLRRVTILIVVAGCLSFAGGVIAGVTEMVTGKSPPFPYYSDLFPLGAYVVFLMAIAMIVHKRAPKLGIDPILDSLVAGVSVAVLQWVLVVIPFLRESNSATARSGVIVFSLMSLVLVLAAVLALVAGSVPSTSNRLLAAGLGVSFVTDVVATLSVDGAIDERYVSIGTMLILALGVSGLLHPSVRGLLDRGADASLRRRLSTRRISVLTFALVTPPCLTLWLLATDAHELERWMAAVAAVVLAPLVLVRLGRLVRQNERLASQEGILRAAGESLVEAETDQDVAMVLDSASRHLFGSALLDAGLVMAPFEPSSDGWTTDLAPVLREVEAAVESLDAPVTGDLLDLATVEVDGNWYAGLLVLQGRLWAVMLLGVEHEITEDQRNALTALCRQGAIAVRAVRRTEEQVRERAEQRFGTLIENSSDIVTILDENDVLVYTSPVSKRLLGFEPEPGFEFRIPQLIHPDDHEVARRLLETVRESGSGTAELRLRHMNGTYLWFEVQATNLIDDPDVAGILINARAVDDRKAAEELLTISEARFKSLVQNNSDLVMVVDAHERVTYASPSSVLMVGLPAEALYDQTMSAVFSAADVDWSTRLREAAKDGKVFEFGFMHADGHWRTLETVVTDLREEIAVGGFVLNARDITERLEMAKDLEYAATHDSLTGMPNRTRLVSQLTEMLSRNSGGSSVAAISIDIDDFRDINDSLGQSIGDEVLIAVSERIRTALLYGDDAARIGADEFAVIIERAHGEEEVMEMAEGILTALAEPLHLGGRELSLSASVGLSIDHERALDAESLLRNSITAIHEAKREGRGRVVRFEHSMRTASSERLELRGDLARAIGTDQIVVNYQPIVDMGTNEILGAEALVRWDHPERGRLSPALFIPLAEDSGLVGALDAQVRAQALKDLSSWRSEVARAKDLTVSVNLSVGELYSEQMVESVMSDLRASGLPSNALVLEVTESNLLDDTDTVRSQMEGLRAQGIRLAVDDFGTGYSSLGYIDRFDFDILKIDRSFVSGLSSRTNQRIVTAVLDLAAQLNAKVVAEGIETDSQRSALLEMGCVIGQGYWFSRPVAADQFRRLLTESVKVGA